jgi:hypothetical protein
LSAAFLLPAPSGLLPLPSGQPADNLLYLSYYGLFAGWAAKVNLHPRTIEVRSVVLQFLSSHY